MAMYLKVVVGSPYYGTDREYYYEVDADIVEFDPEWNSLVEESILDYVECSAEVVHEEEVPEEYLEY